MGWYPGSTWGSAFTSLEDLHVISNHKCMKHPVWKSASLRNVLESAHIFFILQKSYHLSVYKGNYKYLNEINFYIIIWNIDKIIKDLK